MQPRERDQVHSNLPKVAVQLAWEAKACCDSAHCGTHEMVEVPVGRRGKLQRPEANVIQGLIIEKHALVSILDKLVERENGVVRLHHCVRHLG